MSWRNAIQSSMRRKITALVLVTMFFALLINALALLAYDIRSYRQSVLADLRTQADILGRTSAAALAFRDPKDATAHLATLGARTDVEVAALYAPDGTLFAQYRRHADAALPPAGALPDTRIDGERAVVVHDIMERGELIGRVYLQARSGLADRFVGYVRILGGVMLFALLGGFALSAGLQRLVTGPVLRVAEAARSVVSQRDFSIRARVDTQDETRVLADAFNEMLAEVERRAAALRTADRRKDEFLATLAHELRNPLAPIRMMLYLMQQAPQDPKVAGEAREVIDRQVRHMVRLIDDLMDVARITTAKLELRKERTALRAIAEQALETVRPLLAARRHELEVELPPPQAMVEVDGVRLGQVLLNLLNNAAKFTPPGGRIAFRVALDEEHLTARVSDNGPGIAPDMLENIFGMFFQADRSLERETSGLGVGLALSRRIIELHGGSIEARSAGPGRGSEFTVHIPNAAASAARPASATGEAGVARSGPRRRILLADDNKDFADGLAALLRGMGNEVRVAYDGAAAVAAAREFVPEVAFVDIGLPRLNGFEVARSLRSVPATASALLVAVSGWGQPADRERARQAGFHDYLVKPVDPQRIEAVLAKAHVEHSAG